MDRELLFTPWKLGKLEFANRLVRAATYEGLGDVDGAPSPRLIPMYEKLASNDVELIITGFAFVSKEGRAMQLHQTGIESDQRIKEWRPITDSVHKYNKKIFMQISHAGRQTISKVTGSKVYSPSAIKCTYFRQKPIALTLSQIELIEKEYIDAAIRAQKAGFDGVQVHCAHGYLIHQFLSPHTNRRKDLYGGTIENRARFAQNILRGIKDKCGKDYPVLVKISVADDRGLQVADTLSFAKLLAASGNIDGIELSYGTMEFAINIFRGAVPINKVLEHNLLFKPYPAFIKKLWKRFIYPSFKAVFIPFKENYNFASGLEFVENLGLPIILTGGIRRKSEMEKILSAGFTALSLSRPFIITPDFVRQLQTSEGDLISKCIECNLCAVMCDSDVETKCHSVHLMKNSL